MQLALEALSERWDAHYPQISRRWRSHWENLNTLFSCPDDIRKAIYTSNAIETPDSIIRKAIKERKLFPTDDVATMAAAQKWTLPIRHWETALNRF